MEIFRNRLLRTTVFSGLLSCIAGIHGSMAHAEAPKVVPARPNIVVIVLDDVGFADLGVYGSEISTPNIDQLAMAGLRYTRFDTKAVCSASRASLLTGRNSQTVRMESLASDRAAPDPTDMSASKGEMPLNVETVATALKRAGYETSAIGKWHLSPNYDDQPGQGKRSWPLQRGFDHFYGFLSGWTDQYHPALVEGNLPLPTPQKAGYHFSADVVDHAISTLSGHNLRPQFLYLALGAGHSPLQVPKNYIDRYSGVYDIGWDALREKRFARQKELGLMPANAVLPAREPGDAAWASLDEQHRRVFSRFMATYAGFLTHADEQVGRLIAHLKATGQYENTLFVLLSDNGAASEGGPNGSFLRHYGDTTSVAQMDVRLNEIGSEKTMPLYQRPWAYAGVTPFRRYKLWPYLGGVRTPLIVTWPKGILAKGAIRKQYVDVVDIAPTILEVAGGKFEKRVDGVDLIPVAGRSIRPTFTSTTAKTRDVQFFELSGARAITSGKWRAVAMHEPGTSLDTDRWSLFDTDADPAEANDLAQSHASVLVRLKKLWWVEAKRYSSPPVSPISSAKFQFLHMDDAFREKQE